MYIQMYFITNANRQYCTKGRSAAILDQRGSRYADVTDQRYADVTDLAVRPPEHKDVILHQNCDGHFWQADRSLFTSGLGHCRGHQRAFINTRVLQQQIKDGQAPLNQVTALCDFLLLSFHVNTEIALLKLHKHSYLKHPYQSSIQNYSVHDKLLHS